MLKAPRAKPSVYPNRAVAVKTWCEAGERVQVRSGAERAQHVPAKLENDGRSGKPEEVHRDERKPKMREPGNA